MHEIDKMAAEMGITPKQVLKLVIEREGSITDAARVFKCYPNTIYQRLAKYGQKIEEVRSVRVVEIA